MTEVVSRAMRQRLAANREGRLTAEQWRDLVSEPLAPLLILLIPGVFIAGPLLGRLLLGRGVLVALLIALVVIAVPLAFRVWRYSNPVIEHDTLYTGPSAVTRWLFWRAETLYTASGDPVRFRRRVAPFTILRPNTAYLVYYLQEPTTLVLLSLAPVDHPDAALWQPSAR